MTKLLRKQSITAILSPGRSTLSRSASVRHYEKPTKASTAKSTPGKENDTPRKMNTANNKKDTPKKVKESSIYNFFVLPFHNSLTEGKQICSHNT